MADFALEGTKDLSVRRAFAQCLSGKRNNRDVLSQTCGFYPLGDLEVEIVHTLKTLLQGVNGLIRKLYAFQIISKSYRLGREVLGV